MPRVSESPIGRILSGSAAAGAPARPASRARTGARGRVMACFSRSEGRIIMVSPEDARMADAYDLLIQGGTLVDGTGAPPRTGDLGIRGGRIAAVGRAE